VVSPNVRFDAKNVAAWRQASVKWRAAFMGWHPNDEAHRLGPKFARGIEPGDVILIARRANGKPETVGFGTVVGKFRTRLKGFRAPESFGSLRRLEPFIPHEPSTGSSPVDGSCKPDGSSASTPP
jgi:hypothetical protein